MTTSNKLRAACAVSLLAAVFVAAPAMAQSEALLSPYQRYEDAKLRGDLDAAAGYADAAVRAALEEFGPGSAEAVEARVRAAEAYEQLGRLDEAERHLEQALAATEARLYEDHPDLVPLLERLAAINRQQREFEAAAAQLRRVLRIEQAVYGDRSEIVVTTLEALRRLYDEAGDAEQAAEIARRVSAMQQYTRDLGVLDDDSRRYAIEDGYATVRVFYGTDRVPTGKSKPDQFYGSDRGELSVGYVDVSIPETHKYGELETESRFSVLYYLLGEEAKKRRYVLMQSVVSLGDDDFYTELDEYIDKAPSNDIFMFIHGYNSSFEDASRRAAQLAYDLDFEGTPMMYSWPSKQSTTAYTVDEAAVRPSGRKLARLLDRVVHETGAERIHLVAHSMGNRALIEALQAYVLRYGKEASSGTFDQVVFTAPDVDRDYFIASLEDIAGVARRITLYASENDLALQSSRILHGATRAGLAGQTIVRHPTIDTIDVSGIDADVLGHSYFAVNEGAIYDLFRLFWRGDPPPDRCSMRKRIETPPGFWQFDLDNCRGSDLLEAGLLYRKFGRGALDRVQQHISGFDDSEESKQEWIRILDRLEALTETME